MPHSTTKEEDIASIVPDVFRLARILAPNSVEAEDMAQEVLLNTWSQVARGAQIENTRAYCMAALRNLAKRPKHKTVDLAEVEEPADLSSAPARLATKEVLKAISALPNAQAALFTDIVTSDLSYSELAERHHVPIGTVMSRLSRGRAALRVQLGLETENAVSVFISESQ